MGSRTIAADVPFKLSDICITDDDKIVSAASDSVGKLILEGLHGDELDQVKGPAGWNLTPSGAECTIQEHTFYGDSVRNSASEAIPQAQDPQKGEVVIINEHRDCAVGGGRFSAFSFDQEALLQFRKDFDLEAVEIEENKPIMQTL